MRKKIIFFVIIFCIIVRFVNIFGITHCKPYKHGKKIAICISGRLRHFRDDFYSLNKYIFEPTQGDIFLCIDNDETKDDIHIAKQLYRPKKIVLLSERFQNKEQAMFYKIYKCNEMKNKYELDNNIYYDYVIRLRPDVYVYGYVDINKMCPRSLNIPVKSIYDTTYLNFNNYGITDMIAIGTPKIMDIYSECFFSLRENKLCNTPEYKLYEHIKLSDIEIKLFHLFFIPNWITLSEIFTKNFYKKIKEKSGEGFLDECKDTFGFSQ